MNAAPNAVFEAPGPGSWELDRSHYDAAITPISAEIMREATEAAYRKLFETLGVPADGVEVRVLHGFVYSRVRPFFGADSASVRTPPDWLAKAVFRLHPELRRREQRASEFLGGDQFREVLDDWENRIRPELVARNLELQRRDLSSIDDAALANHLDELLQHMRSTFEEHHRLHGYDLGPLGTFVIECRDWGIETADALAALAGASPSTVGPRTALAEIRKLVEAAGITPTSLDDVRNVSEEAAHKLDAYLERHGSVVFSSYDIDSPTLQERPELVLSTIMHARVADGDNEDGTQAAELRDRIPAASQRDFDRLLNDARDAMDMRDNNGPITLEWPVGLVRRGLLEAGRRLKAAGRIVDVDHVFELSRSEVLPVLRGAPAPDAATLTSRATERRRLAELDPPALLGPPADEPPLHVIPPSMARALDTIFVISSALGIIGGEAGESMSGTGIGDSVITGPVRIAATAEEAIADLVPGEILVTRATSPAFNLVLSLAGGLVTVDGGPMSHAAVLSRELGLPAVIGVTDCLDHLKSGDVIELDAVDGVIRLAAT